MGMINACDISQMEHYQRETVRPNKPLGLTPLCVHKIGVILKSGNSPNAFPIKSGGAA